jgi:hypothetical protein
MCRLFIYKHVKDGRNQMSNQARGLLALLNGSQVFAVAVRNDFYTGKYYSSSQQMVYVISRDREHALQVVLDNAAAIHADFKRSKASFTDRRNLLKKSNNIPITADRIKPANVLVSNYKTFGLYYSEFGQISAKIKKNEIIEIED